MRILQVRFKNLNSLVGEWSIDLNHPAYVADGIFAITGPTGAGKSTILDAICLALYGRTPRLSKVTKSGNEVMSRQTGECFAEVTFETQAGRFRCHWSQRRARKKADGELQAPKHEIANADSGQIFEAKLRGVAEQIEACTGMDFDRFTRSMLLAQGGFAAFLQAAADERAPILEQITGTEIYSEISVRVHELRKKERDALDRLTAELHGMQPLGEAQVRVLNEGLARMSLREEELGQEIARQGQAIAWLDGIVLLESELREVGKRQRLWQERQEAFAPRREALQRAGQALELSGDHAGLSALRREQQSVQQGHAESLAALPARQETVKGAAEGLRRAAALLDEKKAAHREAQPTLRQVRELDLRLREKVAPLTAAATAVTEGDKALSQLRTRQEADDRQLGEAKSSLAELLRQLDRSKTDQGLVEEFSRIRETFEALAKLQTQRAGKEEEARAAECQAAASLQAWHDLVAKEEVARRSLDAVHRSLGQKQLELKDLLEGRALSEWRNDLSVLKEQSALLEKVDEALRYSTEAKNGLAAASERNAQLAGQQALIAEQLQVALGKSSALEREVQLLEVQAMLLRKIQSFESARQQLEDDQPCPLCGATEHPYAEGNIPVAHEADVDLIRARQEAKGITAAISVLRVRQAETGKDLEQIAIRQKELTDRLATAQALVEQSWMKLDIGGEGGGLEILLAQRQQAVAEVIARGVGLVQRGEGLEREIVGLRDAVEEGRAAVAKAERQTLEALHRRDSMQQVVVRLGAEAAVLAVQQRRALAEMQADLAAYGVVELRIEGLERVRRDLAERRAAWLTRQKEKAALEQRIAALEIELRHRQEQLQKDEADLGQGRETLRQLREEEQALRDARRQLFGDRDADGEDARLVAAIEAAEIEVETARQALDGAGRQLATLQSRTTELAASLAERAEQLDGAAEAFLLRLAASGFADEEAFIAACLPEEERKRLLGQAQELATEQAELAAMEKEKTLRLAAERQKATTDRPRTELEERLQALTCEQKGMQQEIGAIRQKLQDNEALAQRQRERIEAMERQKEECVRWDLLHELIGSSDGKKYRNFAQGLTFEMMVGHANRQLRKMTDRYLLIRDGVQPLDLNIIDSYQAGEIRSTKNLSGGESFIVSLALALGLSQMASRTIRVDSLFLDEGFGTLDDEALDTALETLAGLRQEGKLIGVISHVQALKERIGTQIQVSPLSGGRSAISGPGCRKADQQLTAAA